jgi:hypothetical protein
MLGLFTRSRRRPRPVLRRAPRHRLLGLQRLETRDCPSSSFNSLTLFGSDGLDEFTSNFAIGSASPDTAPRTPLVALAISVGGQQIGGGNWILSGSVSGVDEVGGLTVTLTGSDSSFGSQSATTESNGEYRLMWTPPVNFQGCSITASVTVQGATATANTSIG